MAKRNAPALMTKWRQKVGITRSGAAVLVGVSQPAWSDWELGKKIPKDYNARKIAKVTRGAVPVEAWG